MRKIKFRGISQRSGKLVYGQLLRGDKGFNIVVDFKTNEHIKMIPIFKGTQSQYTGLKDVNDVEIFEGDILRVWVTKTINFVATVDYLNGAFVIGGIPTGYGYHYRFSSFHDNAGTRYEVIGNIYKNQELLVGDSNE